VEAASAFPDKNALALRVLVVDQNPDRAEIVRRALVDAGGILMKLRGLGEEDAYAALRSKAMDDQKKLVEIAQSVVTAAELLK
jgi:AmiR/NasT family two-component response regulator